MATVERRLDRGRRVGDRLRHSFGSEARDARLTLGLSQGALGRAVRMPASKISRIERGRLPSLSFVDAAVIATALGLDLSVKLFPGGIPLRDVGQASRLVELLRHAKPPLRSRTEVLLPQRDGVVERRSWDATISDDQEDMGVEFEMKIYDAQGQTRRINSKWRDSGLARLLVVVADTRANRRALAELPEYFLDYPRLRTAQVLAALAAGTLPPTGLVLF